MTCAVGSLMLKSIVGCPTSKCACSVHVVGETHAHDYFEVISFYSGKDI